MRSFLLAGNCCFFVVVRKYYYEPQRRIPRTNSTWCLIFFCSDGYICIHITHVQYTFKCESAQWKCVSYERSVWFNKNKNKIVGVINVIYPYGNGEFCMHFAFDNLRLIEPATNMLWMRRIQHTMHYLKCFKWNLHNKCFYIETIKICWKIWLSEKHMTTTKNINIIIHIFVEMKIFKNIYII